MYFVDFSSCWKQEGTCDVGYIIMAEGEGQNHFAALSKHKMVDSHQAQSWSLTSTWD